MATIKFIQAKQFEPTFKRNLNRCNKFFCAVAWGTINPCLPSIEQGVRKIKYFVVGTDFYQTDPKFLERLRDKKIPVKVIPPDRAGTFHPKIYLFINSDGSSAAIVGSANFTKSAMSDNTEAMLIVNGDRNDKEFKELLSFIARCYKDALPVDDAFLRSYQIQRDAKREAFSQLRKFRQIKRLAPIQEGRDPVSMTWNKFVKAVKAEDKHDLEGRLYVLRQARFLFGSKSFNELRPMERKALAGIPFALKNGEVPPGKAEWAWFGSMKGAGDFKNLVIEAPQGLSHALDAIPIMGKIEHNDYSQFISRFKIAFKGKSRKGNIPTASRLITMKRPDYFVCFDGANKKGLAKYFDVAAKSVTLDTYWNFIIEPMLLSPWWRSKRPSGIDGTIWDGRAALLDAIYYSP